MINGRRFPESDIFSHQALPERAPYTSFQVVENLATAQLPKPSTFFSSTYRCSQIMMEHGVLLCRFHSFQTFTASNG